MVYNAEHEALASAGAEGVVIGLHVEEELQPVRPTVLGERDHRSNKRSQQEKSCSCYNTLKHVIMSC